jgi:sec-independent protein translocase protein TatA
MSLLDNPIHVAFLLVLVLLVFGAKRLPEMGRSLGSGMRGFRDALAGDTNTQSQTHAGELTAPAGVAHQASAATPASDAVAPVTAEAATRAYQVVSNP